MITKFENIELDIFENRDFEFLISNSDVAKGYGVSEDNIRMQKSNHKDELIENKHFITVTQKNAQLFGIVLPPKVRSKTFWTKRGVVRLGFFIKSERAKKFRDWAEDLILGNSELVSEPKTRDDLISVSDSELDRELKTLKFILDNYNLSEKEKIEFINKTLEKINFQTLENPHLLKHEPVFTLTQLLKDFGVNIRTADFNRKLESYGIIQRFGNGWILLDMKFGENRHFKEGTNHRYYKSTFQELLDLVL